MRLQLHWHLHSCLHPPCAHQLHCCLRQCACPDVTGLHAHAARRLPDLQSYLMVQLASLQGSRPAVQVMQ